MSPTVPPRSGVLRVLTLNVGSLLEPDWDRRRHEIVAWLDHLDADVVCLQEVWEDERTGNTGGWLAEQSAAGWHGIFGGAAFAEHLWPDPTMRFGSMILSRWPIDEHEFVRLPLADDPSGFTSGVPFELLAVRTAGLDVFSVHLAAAPHEAHHRRVQVLAIDEFVRGWRGHRDTMTSFGAPRPEMPAILCGDFNAEPESDEIRFLSSLTVLDGRTTFWQDAWRVAGDGGPGLTQDWRTNPIAEAMNVHRKRIDYVFVGDAFQRAGGAGRVVRCEVVCDEPRTGVVSSDHFGVMADVVWPTRPA
ncbi:MAG: endonuclease/exonuclease/phosphatase family protein [Actinomycetota bacterium]